MEPTYSQVPLLLMYIVIGLFAHKVMMIIKGKLIITWFTKRKWLSLLAKHSNNFSYNDKLFFASDGAPKDIIAQRQQGFNKLAPHLVASTPDSLVTSQNLAPTSQVPLPFRQYLAEAFTSSTTKNVGQKAPKQATEKNSPYDLSAVEEENVFSDEFNQNCIAQAKLQVNTQETTVSSYSSLVAENIEMIKNITELKQVLFYSCASEAIQQAITLARHTTQKQGVIQFTHHQFSAVNNLALNDQVNDINCQLFVANSEQSLQQLSSCKNIACVLINPIQALMPHCDSEFTTQSLSKLSYDNDWLVQLSEICRRRNILLILDETITGFRLAYRGAQAYFGVQADMVIYGKNISAGIPIGVLAHNGLLTNSIKASYLDKVSNNERTYVMAVINEFLSQLLHSNIQHQYQQSKTLWHNRVKYFNHQLQQEKLPIKIVHMHTLLAIVFTQASSYHWVLAFYLRAYGLKLNNINASTMIMGFNMKEHTFRAIVEKFINACQAMRNDGWWWQTSRLTAKTINQQFLHDMIFAQSPVIARFFPSPLRNRRQQRLVQQQ